MLILPTVYRKPATGYTINQSCMFDGTGYLYWTPGGAGDSRRVYSVSFWMKFDDPSLSSSKYPMSAGSDGNNEESFALRSGTNKMRYRGDTGGATWTEYLTTQDFVDPTGWVHYAMIRNENTVTQYVNGVAISAYDTSTAPTSDDGYFGHTVQHRIGEERGGGQTYTGLLAEVIYLDNTEASITDFGVFDEATGEWVPIDPSGLSFGSNGFWLDFADSSNLGNDVSGNNNDFTTSGLGTDHRVLDVPTDDADNNAGNLAHFDPLLPASLKDSPTLAEGNMKMTGIGNTQNHGTIFTIPLPDSGKFYIPLRMLTATNSGGTGNTYSLAVSNPGVDLSGVNINDLAGAWGVSHDVSRFLNTNGTRSDSASTSLSRSVNDVVELAIDIDNDKMWMGEDGTWFGSDVDTGDGNPATGANPYWSGIGLAGKNVHVQVYYNMSVQLEGPHNVTNSPPSGFSYFGTHSLPAPAIVNPDEHFQIESVSHDGTSTAFTLGWNADTYDTLFMIKNLDASEKWYYVDGLRGYDKYVESPSAFNVGSTTDSNVISVSGTTITLGSTLANNNYVVYCWRAGAAGGSSNTDGSITTTASANTTAGFSIITYTGSGANATVGHGLSSAPTCVQVKSTAGTPSGGTWIGYHQEAGNTKSWTWTKNENSPTNSTYWQDTTPSSSVVTIGTNTSCNASSETFVMYIWHDVEGFSHFGGYTGNGASDGPLVKSLLKPALDITRGITISSARGSHFRDEVRGGPGNPNGKVLQGHAADADSSNSSVDFTATGLKIRDSSLIPNASGGTFAFARWGRPLGGSGGTQAKGV